MLNRIHSGVLSGVEAKEVAVEVHCQDSGKNSFSIIGMADNSIRESRERIVAALECCGYHVPKRILVNLAPAELKKEGAALDLAIAVGVLVACGAIPKERIDGMSFFGELSLDASILPVRGVISHALHHAEQGNRSILLPLKNLPEARGVRGVDALGFAHLQEIIEFFETGDLPAQSCAEEFRDERDPQELEPIFGHTFAKRALVVAAAGGHNVLMIGPPGCGKSMLARRLPALLPPLSEREGQECAKIYSATGRECHKFLAGEVPFRAPHHVISEVGLCGGGSGVQPGEISLAHNGVLFLDEFPEFQRTALEALRAPLEEGKVRIVRAKVSRVLPARFQLVAAMNPCPCGNFSSTELSCRCSLRDIQGYLSRLSGPMLDRIDLQLELESSDFSSLREGLQSGASESVNESQDLVQRARERQLSRQGSLNRDLGLRTLTSPSQIEEEAFELLEQGGKAMRFSTRGNLRVLRVARTLADLEGQERVLRPHMAEALRLRSLERLQSKLQMITGEFEEQVPSSRS